MISLKGIRIERLTTAKTPAERRNLERKAKTGKAVSPMRGMFADTEEWSKLSPTERSRRIIATLSDKHPQWVFCLFSAAAVYGLEVGRDDLASIHRLDSRRARTNGQGTVVAHRMPCTQPVVVDGIQVTQPLQTVVDCLCALGFERALAIADSAMRVLSLSKHELQEELEARGACEGWKVARDAIAYADPLSTNGGESVARAVMIEQGFAIPRLQVKRHDPLDPNVVYYVDFFWELGEAGNVIGELDGRDKYVLPEMTEGRDVLDILRDERLRESRISADRARVMRFSFRDVMDVERFTQLMEAYGIPRGASRAVGR